MQWKIWMLQCSQSPKGNQQTDKCNNSLQQWLNVGSYQRPMILCYALALFRHCSFSKLLVSKCCHRKPNLYVWDVTKQLWICGWWCDKWRSLFTLSSCYVCVTAVTIPTKRPTPGIHNPRGHVPKGLNSLHPCSSVRTVRSSKWWGGVGGIYLIFESI